MFPELKSASQQLETKTRDSAGWQTNRPELIFPRSPYREPGYVGQLFSEVLAENRVASTRMPDEVQA